MRWINIYCKSNSTSFYWKSKRTHYDRINFTLTGFVCTAVDIGILFTVDYNMFTFMRTRGATAAFIACALPNWVNAFYKVPTTMRSNAITRTILIRLHNSKSMRLFDIPNLDIALKRIYMPGHFTIIIITKTTSQHITRPIRMYNIWINQCIQLKMVYMLIALSVSSLRYLRFTVDFITFGFFRTLFFHDLGRSSNQ